MSFMAFGKPLTESALMQLAQEGSYKHLNQIAPPPSIPEGKETAPPKPSSSGIMGWFSRKPVSSSGNLSQDLKTATSASSDSKSMDLEEKIEVKVDANTTMNYDSGDEDLKPKPSQFESTDEPRVQYRKTLRPSSEMLVSPPIARKSVSE
jgi:hypothetical protein